MPTDESNAVAGTDTDIHVPSSSNNSTPPFVNPSLSDVDIVLPPGNTATTCANGNTKENALSGLSTGKDTGIHLPASISNSTPPSASPPDVDIFVPPGNTAHRGLRRTAEEREAKQNARNARRQAKEEARTKNNSDAGHPTATTSNGNTNGNVQSGLRKKPPKIIRAATVPGNERVGEEPQDSSSAVGARKSTGSTIVPLRGLAKNREHQQNPTANPPTCAAHHGRGLRKNNPPQRASQNEENDIEVSPDDEPTPKDLEAQLSSRPSNECTEEPLQPSNRVSNSNLVEATPVKSSRVLAQAHRVSESVLELQAHTEQTERQWRRIVCCIVGFSLVILAIGLGVGLGLKKNETAAPLPLPSKSPILSLESHVLSLLPTYTQESIAKDATSPQAIAYNWVMADPNLDTYSNERIIQRFALGTLYHATDGDEWTRNTHWMSYEVHECEWHAQDASRIFNIFKESGGAAQELYFNTVISPLINVSFPCEDPDAEKQYSHLWLLANGLKGQLPPEVYLLTSLKSINLFFNSLKGSGLSTEIGKLSSLEGLDLSKNQISGTIPTEIGLLSRLLAVRLSENELSSTIPSQLGKLTDNLTLLDLKNNQLVGNIPQELGSLENLISLLLYDNQLSGTIPTSIGQLSETKWLALDKNELMGPIPSELGLLKSLGELWLSQNRLTGIVPWEIGNLVTNGNLKLFHIYKNNLTGILPSILPTDDLCLIDTVSNYNSQLIGCNCTCSFQRHGLHLCSSLPSGCTRLLR